MATSIPPVSSDWVELKKFSRIQTTLQSVELEHEASDVPSDEVRRRLRKLSLEAAERFPDTEDLLLPTAFGNTIRAFEVYSRVMYGFEAITGWDRLLAVVPKDYRGLVDSEKTYMDFWVNLWLLGSLFSLASLALVVWQRKWLALLYPLLAFTLSWMASRAARKAAVAWGAMVKAAFDVFLPALRKRLGFEKRFTREEERKFWKAFSQAVTNRRVDLLPPAEPSQ